MRCFSVQLRLNFVRNVFNVGPLLSLLNLLLTGCQWSLFPKRKEYYLLFCIIGGFKVKLAVWPLKGSEVLLKQYCSITLVTAQQGKSACKKLFHFIVTAEKWNNLLKIVNPMIVVFPLFFTIFLQCLLDAEVSQIHVYFLQIGFVTPAKKRSPWSEKIIYWAVEQQR